MSFGEYIPNVKLQPQMIIFSPAVNIHVRYWFIDPTGFWRWILSKQICLSCLMRTSLYFTIILYSALIRNQFTFFINIGTVWITKYQHQHENDRNTQIWLISNMANILLYLSAGLSLSQVHQVKDSFRYGRNTPHWFCWIWKH